MSALNERKKKIVSLSVRSISKSFSGVTALADVDLVVQGGEILGLVGANGAGKSTLINILTGQLQPDKGSLMMNGEELVLTSPRASQLAGIGVVRQELDLVPDLTVAENLVLGIEPRFQQVLGLNRKLINEKALSLLSRVGLKLDPDQKVYEVSIGDRQLIAAARALRDADSVLLLDEPTSSLTPYEAERLFAAMRLMRQEGVGVVFISHRLDEVAQICDRVVVLRDGQVAGEFKHFATNVEPIVEAMVPGTAALARVERTGELGEAVLKLEEVVFGSRSPVSLEIKAGEVLGIFGLVGAGKSSLGRCISGSIPIRGGLMRVRGKNFLPRDPSQAFKLGVACLSEDRRNEGILPHLSIRDNMVVRTPGETARRGVLRQSAITLLVKKMIDVLAIKTSNDRLGILSLSGGNQQKVLLARLLAENLSVLVLDEPTHGIDVRAKRDLLETINKLTAQGLAVLMISAEISELLAACDRILVMRGGSVVAEFDATKTNEQMLMSAATGG
jgi:ribose transport system ATP-binding protein